MASTFPEIEHLLAWRRGEQPGPLRLHLTVTERCNLGCRSCFMGHQPAGERQREVSDERLVAVVEEAIGLGVGEFYLVGGEAFLRKDLVLGLMTRIKAAGRRGELTTNGTLLDAEDIDRIVEMGWDRLQVSIDGPDAAVNDALRPPGGTFDKAVATLDRLAAAKKRTGSALPEVHVATVVSRTNVSHLPGMVDLAAAHGAEEVTFQALKDMSEEFGDLQLTDDQRADLDGIAAQAQARARLRGLATNAGDLRQPTLRRDMTAIDAVFREDVDRIADPLFRAHCFTPWTTLVVHVDGRVSPCWEWRGPDLGDVHERSLAALWRGPVFRRWRRDFLAHRMPDRCSQCCLGFVDHIRWLRLEGLCAAKEHDAVLDLAGRLLAWQPDHRHAVVARAKGLVGLGRPLEAEAWVRHCFDELLPGRCLERAYLVDVLCDGGRLDTAVELGDRVAAEAPPDGPVADAARRLLARIEAELTRADG